MQLARGWRATEYSEAAATEVLGWYSILHVYEASFAPKSWTAGPYPKVGQALGLECYSGSLGDQLSGHL